VIGALPQAVQDSTVSSSFDACGGYGVGEKHIVYHLRATEGE
jgi:hypothetical protein